LQTIFEAVDDGLGVTGLTASELGVADDNGVVIAGVEVGDTVEDVGDEAGVGVLVPAAALDVVVLPTVAVDPDDAADEEELTADEVVELIFVELDAGVHPLELEIGIAVLFELHVHPLELELDNPELLEGRTGVLDIELVEFNEAGELTVDHIPDDELGTAAEPELAEVEEEPVAEPGRFNVCPTCRLSQLTPGLAAFRAPQVQPDLLAICQP